MFTDRIYVDPNGDLTLIVGPEDTLISEDPGNIQGSQGEQDADTTQGNEPVQESGQGENDGSNADPVEYVVSKKAMSLASLVWDAMFNRNFSETTAKRVPFVGDDPFALLVVLRIAHMQFSQLPKSVSFRQLLEIAVICDKYDTLAVIRPWLSTWADPHKNNTKSPEYEEWFFIAWVFGDAETFKDMATWHIMKVTIDNDGMLLTGSGTPFGSNMPPDLVDTYSHFVPLFSVFHGY
ncbi:hypothetical protein K402DRAFT_416779 [Aulographum hederae CBS 113979]|uniref:BTB domain-containing protein n=1 Tax=Aulographum hederae CBS 113979 TaxID=1176131 RepID=A0A6G1HE11_9PEZI|nr:hypothetical protein K402DRAFT_416779 [Aulographum hederae CBS 113979]